MGKCVGEEGISDWDVDVDKQEKTTWVERLPGEDMLSSESRQECL